MLKDEKVRKEGNQYYYYYNGVQRYAVERAECICCGIPIWNNISEQRRRTRNKLNGPFCSGSCASNYHNQCVPPVTPRVRLNCAQCGVIFERRTSVITKKHRHGLEYFCSYRCAIDFRLAHREAQSSALICTQCGVTFKREKAALEQMQRQKSKPFCSRQCSSAFRRGKRIVGRKGKYVDPKGYIHVYIPEHPMAGSTGYIPEHRLIMEKFLGRSIYPEETVHHKNGIRNDNRLENLELWAKSHPSGQRISDLVKWAREFVAKYENDT
jgi:hypothetical protein